MSNLFQDPDAKTVFVLRLKPRSGFGWSVPVVQRLRLALKRLSRDYGLVCIYCQPEPPTQTHHENVTPTQSTGAAR